MPIYKYQCQFCGYSVKKLQKMSDSAPKVDCCEKESLKKIIGAPNFSLAGGGWFKDGYEKSSEKT
jgi:putative FmdB family regulatory protein